MSRIGIAVVAWLIVASSTQGAPLQWKAIGPWSETVEAIAIDPKSSKVLYAATRNGIFKSNDGAETWVRKSKGIDEIHALSVAVDPKTPSTLYTGAYRGGLFKSIDGGESWKSVKPSGGAALYVFGRVPLEHIAIDPVNPQTLMFTSVYKSTNGAADFKQVELGAGSTDVNHIGFDPKNPKIVYAAGTGDLMKSSDAGATWSRVDFGIPSPAHARVTAIHPGSGEILLGTGYSGLHKSTDSGKTWKGVGEGLREKARIESIAWDPSDARNVYVTANLKIGDEASVYRSTDGGGTFEHTGKDLPYEKISSLVMDPKDPKTLYAGAPFSGIFKTTDGGETWNEKSAGFGDSFRTIRALAASGPGTLFATTYGAVYRTNDDGKSWRRLRAGLKKGLDYTFLAAGGAAKPAAIVGADDAGLVHSTDGGETWADPPRSAPLKCVAPDPANPRAFYMCAGSGGVLHGADGSWQFVADSSAPSFIALAVDPQNPQNVFGGTYRNLQRSTNGGKKWKEWKPFEKVKGGVVRPAEHRRIFAIAFDPKNAKTLYVATEADGVFKSTDGGETWSLAGLTAEKPTAFAIDPSDPQRLVAGTSEKGVFVSTDGGASWVDASAGLPEDEDRKKKERISAVVFAPGTPQRLYVATEGGGVYRAE